MFVGLAASLVPLGILLGILAASGFDTVHWNGEALHGVAGLVTGPLLGLLSALMFSVFLGLRLPWDCGFIRSFGLCL